MFSIYIVNKLVFSSRIWADFHTGLGRRRFFSSKWSSTFLIEISYLYLPPWNIFIAKKMSSFEPVPTMICSGQTFPCNLAIAVRNSAIPEKSLEIGWPSVKFMLRKNFLLFCNLNLDLNFRVSTFRGPNIRRTKQERRMRPCEKGARYFKRDTK